MMTSAEEMDIVAPRVGIQSTRPSTAGPTADRAIATISLVCQHAHVIRTVFPWHAQCEILPM